MDSLQDLAQQADATANSEIPFARVWGELVSGACSVVDGFFGPARCYLVLADNQPLARESSGRHLEILERILSGDPQNAVAIDFGLSASTVALSARRVLTAMGVAATTSRTHPLLMLAARSARERDFERVASSSSVCGPNWDLRVLSMPRPERELLGQLPPGEADVVRLLVEGRSHREIANLRKTSARTIANQLASVFRRQGVSGRSELIHSLFPSGAAQGSRPSGIRLAACNGAASPVKRARRK